jgi:hypothetical protein
MKDLHIIVVFSAFDNAEGKVRRNVINFKRRGDICNCTVSEGEKFSRSYTVHTN